MLVSKVVITFVSKSRSKLAVYTNVEWLRYPPRALTSMCYLFPRSHWTPIADVLQVSLTSKR